MKEKQLDIYTDAGGNPESYGLGVLIIKPNETEQKLLFRTNLNLLKKEFGVKKGINNTTIIETYAIIKALENVNTDEYDKIVIYTDSSQTYDVLNNLGKHLRNNELYQEIVIKLRKMLSDKIEIRWIKSHCGVYGNELADQYSTFAKNKTRNIPFCNDINYENLLKLLEINFFLSFELDNYFLKVEKSAKKYSHLY